MPTEVYENEHDDEPLPAAGYRTYEVYQRERVGETTNLLKPRELTRAEMLTDPYRLLTILRENYPCYRDWPGNRFWITRYDDVTSVFTDEANYETRSKRWFYGDPTMGRDLWHNVDVLSARANRTDAAIEDICNRILGDLGPGADLATDMAARLPLEIWGAVLDLPAAELGQFASRYWRMQRGAGWDPISVHDGRAAFSELAAFFDPLVVARRADTGDDLISVAASVEIDGGPVTGADIATTVLEADHETLHGGLANMWFQLLTNPDQFAVVRSDRRLVKFAWLETLRHSPPVQSAARFARHEVERFGRLIPKGGLLYCSAAAANRDPRAFGDPDTFQVERKDLCQREPRGQHRADGLPSGITFGTGRPSVHPAVPKQRPRSIYAITRDVAVTMSHALLDEFPNLSLAAVEDAPDLRSLRLGEMFTCWKLPVTI